LNTKAKGNKLEWAAITALRMAGYTHVQRGSASKGIDVIAGLILTITNDNTIAANTVSDVRVVHEPMHSKLFISCKANSYMAPAETKELIEIAAFWQATPCLTKKIYGKNWNIINLLQDNALITFTMVK